MEVNNDQDVKRRGVIAELVRLNSERGTVLGRTALLKQIYFLQTLYGVDCGYDFTLYTYGPFSAQVLADLDDLYHSDAVEVYFDTSRGGYAIYPGSRLTEARTQAAEFLNANQDKIAQVVEEFGNMWAKELELRATIVFVEREVKGSSPAASDDDIIAAVHRLKPHFDKPRIHAAMGELQGKGYLLGA